MKLVQTSHSVPVKSWAADHHETGALRQAEATSGARGVVGVALMPDAHVGIGASVGTVVATEGTILPATVGVDLGCGMTAAKLNTTANGLPDDLKAVLAGFGEAIPMRDHGDRHHPSGEQFAWLSRNPPPSGRGKVGTPERQLGTLGSGNHFVELSTDKASGDVWVVVHSGSRGIGNQLAQYHIKLAAELDKAASDPDLAAFTEGTSEFGEYVADMLWAQEYAYQNREFIVRNAVIACEKNGVRPVGNAGRLAVTEVVRCHHNYAELEEHHGANVWVTRKGAIRAREGDFGIIPGSMGDSTFLVEGLGNAESYTSAAHGAGRRLSRRQAKSELDVQEFRARMEGRTWQAASVTALLDEAPAAYKPIEEVMAQQADLCKPIAELSAVVNYKGV